MNSIEFERERRLELQKTLIRVIRDNWEKINQLECHLKNLFEVASTAITPQPEVVRNDIGVLKRWLEKEQQQCKFEQVNPWYWSATFGINIAEVDEA